MKSMHKFWVTAVVIISSLCGSPRLWAQQVSSDAPGRCQSLRSVDYTRVPDALIEVLGTRLVNTNGDAPSYCEVDGYVAPNIGFLIRLPVASWNGKFIEVGCGGFCGSTDHIAQCADPLRRGYACAVSDGGHRSNWSNSSWAYNNITAMIDYLVRASHVTAVAGKAISATFYGQVAKKSYFMGCSAGGEQAMVEAQRFPWDFDGIIAGQPSGEAVGNLNMLWGSRALTGKNGAPLLSPTDLNMLHDAVVAKCDLNDGIKDGLIGDPRTCAFDPSELLCSSGKRTQCLTAKQVEAAKKIYEGPTSSTGEPISLPGALRGSEPRWSIYSSAHMSVAEPFRYYEFQPAPGPAWSAEDFDFDRDYKRLGMAEGLISPDNPDLRKFKAAGGKLLAYAGWNDVIGMPMASVDYYETAEKLLGGRTDTQKFLRLFMIPGMNHCFGGDGAFAIDYLSNLEDWVEHAKAPDRLIGAHIELPADPTRRHDKIGELRFPLNPSEVIFSRPVYPYPALSRYLGKGEPSDPNNFGAVYP